MTTEIIDKGLADELIDSSHNPPGNDVSLASFYGAVIQMVDAEDPLTYTLAAVKQRRPDLTDKHFVNLLFRAVQAIKMDEGDLSYRGFQEAAQWKKVLTKINTNSHSSEQFREILHRRSTSTSIYQRYAGPYAVISSLYDGNSVTVADLGCGGNYGLRGIELHEPFRTITDLTPQGLVSTLLNNRINLLQGLAIDKENPDTPENTRWRLACSFYPKELDQLLSIQDFEARIRRSSRVKFIQADLLNSSGLTTDTYDVVILSTILYQLQRQEQITLLGKARDLLTENGIVIVQDFAAKDPERLSQLDFAESWFGKEFTYRTFITGKKADEPFREALEWNNGRCKIVRQGEDFDAVFQSNQLSSVRAALAHSTS